MGKHLHTRIFLSMLAVIVLLLAAIWLTFSNSSEWYVRSIARENAGNILSQIEELAEKTGAQFPSVQNREDARAYSKALLREVKQYIKAGETPGRILVFNSRYENISLVSPADDIPAKEPDRLAPACQAMLLQGNTQDGAGAELSVDGERWYAAVFSLETGYSVRAEYFVAVAQIPDISVLWNYAGRLLAIIAAAGICAAAFLVWLIARSISRPLEQLCRQADEIGNGKDAQIPDSYSLQEFESLKEAYNRMSRRLRQTEEEKNRFFQNASHDLKTPLASITGYAQGISCGIMTDTKKAAAVILAESLRMTGLVESILTLTKVDCHQWRLRIVKLDLEEFLEERLEALKGIARNLSLRLTAEAEDLYVSTDPDLLGRILENVISNCVRYAQTEVRISLRDSDGTVWISIEDDGPGFDTDDLPHIFERFYQGDRGHCGIGLSVVWAGMQYLGGRAEAGNLKTPHHGAFYHLYLPK